MSSSFPQIINLKAWTEEMLAEKLPDGAKSRAKEIANFVREQKDNKDFQYEKHVIEKLSNNFKFDPTVAEELAQIAIFWEVGVSIVEDPCGSTSLSNSQY